MIPSDLLDLFRAEFPEFAEYQETDTKDNKVYTYFSDAVIEQCLKRAYGFHNTTKRGTIYAAAHLLSLDQSKPSTPRSGPDGGLGVVAKETLGPKTIEYMTNAGSDERKAFWATSPYGREFLKIEQRNVRQAFGILIV